jgi:hypothetical protein
MRQLLQAVGALRRFVEEGLTDVDCTDAVTAGVQQVWRRA